MRRSQSGYSLVEMMMVVLIAGITAAVAIPTTANAIANTQLRGSAASFASMLQQARMTAIQKNSTYTIKFGLTSGRGAYADLNSSNSYTSGEPIVQFSGTVDQVSTPTSSPTSLDSTVGWTSTTANLAFNSRGLPCNPSAAPCSTNVNYVFYFRDNRAFGGHGWSAVSISAAGRTKAWWWNGSSWIS